MGNLLTIGHWSLVYSFPSCFNFPAGMGDGFSDSRGSNDEVTNNIGNENFAAEKIYPCNFCDKIFTGPQALGGHLNAHRDERLPMINPSNLLTTPPLPLSYVLPHAPHYRRPPVTHAPDYSNPYDLLTQIRRRRAIFAPTNHASTRYHPYTLPTNRVAEPRPNGTVQTRPNQYVGFNGSVRLPANPSLRLFGNSLQGLPMNQSTNLQPAHYVPRGLIIERDERFLKCQNDYNSNEHGTSSSGQMQGTGGTRRDDEEEELDLTLHLWKFVIERIKQFCWNVMQ